MKNKFSFLPTTCVCGSGEGGGGGAGGESILLKKKLSTRYFIEEKTAVLKGYFFIGK